MSGFGKVLTDLFGPKVSTIPVIAVPPPVVTPPVDPMPYLSWSYYQIGQAMVTGERASPFCIDCFSHTDDTEVSDTGIEAPGCSAFVCAALEKNGYKSTHSAAAVSYATYGTPSELVRGCIVVFRWSNNQHHVTFCESVNQDGTFQGLGGNQSGAVCIETFSQASVIAKRQPVKP